MIHRLGLVALRVVGVLGLALTGSCTPAPAPCSPFESSQLELAILEAEGGPLYDHSATAGPVFTDMPSCGALEPAFDSVRFDLRQGLEGDAPDCNPVTGATPSLSPDVDWYDFGAGDPVPDRLDPLLAWFQGPYAFAQGWLSLPGGCEGTYTVILEIGWLPWIEAEERFDYLYVAAPGERPPWYVSRVFQPATGCESLGLQPDEPMCTDAWAATMTSITPP